MQNLIIDEITKAVWNEFTAKTHNEKRDYQYSVNDLKNVITEAYKNAEALQLQQTGVSSCSPFMKQVFYVLFNKENKDFFHSKTATHTFSAPLLLDAMIFKNKELALKYNNENKLKGFSIVKVVPKYSFE